MIEMLKYSKGETQQISIKTLCLETPPFAYQNALEWLIKARNEGTVSAYLILAE
jgi:hypothetical protein